MTGRGGAIGPERGQGVDDLEKRGGHPQKRERDAAGVSLSQTESRFLELLADPFRDDEEFTAAGRAARLTENQIAYIDEWVMNHGAHWLTCESAGFNALEGARVFRNPAVARIINAAAEAGLCAGTVPSKEEVAGFLGQQMRNPFVPAATQQKAAETVAKMMGYFPAGQNGAASGGVSINIVNPFPSDVNVTMDGEQ